MQKDLETTERNYAFIDGQNLYMGLEWKLDYKKFRQYLKDKYGIKKAYYFLDKGKFKKILVPNIKFASSLYKKDERQREGFLVKIDDFRKKLEYEKGPHKD